MQKKDKKASSLEKDITTLDELNRTLIDQYVNENPPPAPPPGSLTSLEQLKKRQKRELEKLFDVRSVTDRLKKANNILKDHHVTCVDPEQDAARNAFAKQVAKQLQSKEETHHHYTFEEILCVPREKIDAAYAVGKELFEKKYFSDACDVFFLLTQLNPYYANVWIAMGLCWQNLQQYDSALGIYAVAILLNEKNPEPYLNSIECYLAQKNSSEAKLMIDLVSPVIEKHANKDLFQKRLVLLKNQSNK